MRDGVSSSRAHGNIRRPHDRLHDEPGWCEQQEPAHDEIAVHACHGIVGHDTEASRGAPRNASPATV
jgi:hypothetical protein